MLNVGGGGNQGMCRSQPCSTSHATNTRLPLNTLRHQRQPRRKCKHRSPSRHTSPDSNSGLGEASPSQQIRQIHPNCRTKTHHKPKLPLKYHLRCCGRLVKLVHKCHTSRVLLGYC
ncbi:hypothetical protein FA95DRAFT_533018 [Auriscalpium vulgare]|uniref:Uncharacterized protein n=1 Tax=Auriscalpium vulgare TaxID=40419 RepID=A0ACB8RFC1_9AGAM|nr:hypothetical protein FA95DRAFT_533018 [Auriscalpium vulgare]